MDYKKMYLEERVKALRNEMAFLQADFSRVQQTMQLAEKELAEYLENVQKEPGTEEPQGV